MNKTNQQNANFVWADLSSYNTTTAIKFYSKVFDWKSYNQGKASAVSEDRFGMNAVNYYISTLQNKAVAGIFDMPPFFQKINMPSFWMSYLAINQIDQLIERARQFEGVTIDIEPTPFGEGMMALIRDPLGAGFTIYEGPSINSKGDGSEYGRMVWNELITASIATIEPFYKDVFGFTIVKDETFNGKCAKLYNGAGEEIAGIQEVDEEIRSEKVYWIPFFSVDTIPNFEKKAVSANGTLLFKTESSKMDNTAIFYDADGAVFGVTETGTVTNSNEISSSVPSRIKWKSIVAMALIWIAVMLNWQWVWGILFLTWILPDIRNRYTHFVEGVSQDENPFVFWLIIGSWLSLSLFLIFA